MAIAKPNHEPTCNNRKQSIPDAYNTITKSDRDSPLVLQTTCVTGSPWEATYYRQRLRGDNEHRYQDSELSPSIQSYTRINNTVLRLIEGISPSIDSGLNTTVGEAVLTGFTPIVGDAFIASIGGVYYVFNVTRTTPLSFTSTTSYRIEFEMACQADGSETSLDLDNKTYETLTFSGDYGTCGNPLLKPETVEVLDNLNNLIPMIIDEYLRMFLDADTDLIILEKDNIKLYDDHLTRYILDTWPLRKSRKGRRIRGISKPLSEDRYTTVWDTLIYKNSVVLDPVHVMYLTSSNKYRYNYSTISTTAHRVNYLMDHALARGSNDNTLLSLYGGGNDLGSMTYDGIVRGMYPEITDEWYVLSEGYYAGNGTSVLELLLYKYKKNTIISEHDVMSLVEHWKNIPLVNKYYHTPLLLTLMVHMTNGGVVNGNGSGNVGPSATCP